MAGDHVRSPHLFPRKQLARPDRPDCGEFTLLNEPQSAGIGGLVSDLEGPIVP